jgi:F-type H+-transporting ATPase subunit gamma
MNKVLAHVTANAGDFRHPLLEVRASSGKRAVIVVSSDKGLAGALNSNLTREVAKLDKDKTVHIAAGKKGAQFISRTKRNLAAEFTYKDAPQFAEARAISKFAQDLFLKGEVDAVDILFTNFISTLTQKPEIRPLLPVGEIRGVSAGLEGDHHGEALQAGATEYIFEPNPDAVLGALLPHYLNFQVYQILLEAKASEQSARMVAMKNATDNAKQLIKDLTLEYNKLRQANITKELLEITSAAMAMS